MHVVSLRLSLPQYLEDFQISKCPINPVCKIWTVAFVTFMTLHALPHQTPIICLNLPKVSKQGTDWLDQSMRGICLPNNQEALSKIEVL